MPLGSLAATGSMYKKPSLGSVSGRLGATDRAPSRIPRVVTRQCTGGTTNIPATCIGKTGGTGELDFGLEFMLGSVEF